MRARKSGAERRTEIVEAAVELADAVGPERLTTSTIADCIGLSQAAVFKHFPTKQSIWEAIVAWLAERLERRWAAARRPGMSAEEALRAVLRNHLETVQSVPAIPSILFSRELHSRNEALRHGLESLMRRFHAHLAAIIAVGKREGAFRGDLDETDAAYLALGVVQGLVIRWSLGGRVLDLPNEGDRMVTLLVQGFLPNADTASMPHET